MIKKTQNLECPFCASNNTIFEDEEHHFCNSCKCFFADSKSPTIRERNFKSVDVADGKIDMRDTYSREEWENKRKKTLGEELP